MKKFVLAILGSFMLLCATGCDWSLPTPPKPIMVVTANEPKQYPANAEFQYHMASDANWVGAGCYVTVQEKAGRGGPYYFFYPTEKNSRGYVVFDGTHDNIPVPNVQDIGDPGVFQLDKMDGSFAMQVSNHDEFSSILADLNNASDMVGVAQHFKGKTTR